MTTLAHDCQVAITWTAEGNTVSVLVMGCAGPFDQTAWITSLQPVEGFTSSMWHQLWPTVSAWLRKEAPEMLLDRGPLKH